jgi:hypothetical protein
LFFLTEGGGGRLTISVQRPRTRDPLTAERATTTGHSPSSSEPITMPLLAGQRVLVIGINYSPAPTGIAPYTTGIAKQLAQHAKGVKILTGMPHSASWAVVPGHRRGLEEPHTHDAPQVIRLAHYVPGHRSALPGAQYELAFLLLALWAARRLPHRPDIIVCAAPALGGAAARLAIQLDVSLITIVHDLMAKTAGQSGTSGGGTVQKLTARVEGAGLPQSTRAAVVAEGFRPAIAQYGVPAELIHQLPNSTQSTTASESRDRLGWLRGCFLVTNAGNIGAKRDLGNVIEAARLLAGQSDLLFLLLPTTTSVGSQRGEIADQASIVDRVTLLPPQTDTEYSLAPAAADALRHNEWPSMADILLPSKFAPYLSAGQPPVAAVSADGAPTADFDGALAELAASDGEGMVVEPGNPHALAPSVRHQIECRSPHLSGPFASSLNLDACGGGIRSAMHTSRAVACAKLKNDKRSGYLNDPFLADLSVRKPSGANCVNAEQASFPPHLDPGCPQRRLPGG